MMPIDAFYSAYNSLLTSRGFQSQYFNKTKGKGFIQQNGAFFVGLCCNELYFE